MAEERIRKPVFSGKFYPDDSETLQFAIRQFLDTISLDCKRGHLKSLVCPHAGYIYSGYTAGHSYKVLEQCLGGFKNDLKIFLIGPCHNTEVEGLALSTMDEWNTPIGGVEVSSVVSDMIQSEEDCHENNQAHELEHSLEVQLPFLQVTLANRDFNIIPILVSKGDYSAYADILEKYLDDDSLLLVSTDLSHYDSYDSAKEKDKKTIDAILDLNIDQFQSLGDACGKLPLLILLELAKRNKWKPNLADYRNSGDTAGDKTAVVGYASIYLCG